MIVIVIVIVIVVVIVIVNSYDSRPQRKKGPVPLLNQLGVPEAIEPT